jgi:hypothetical protein
VTGGDAPQGSGYFVAHGAAEAAAAVYLGAHVHATRCGLAHCSTSVAVNCATGRRRACAA